MRKYLVDEVGFITDVHYEESVWMIKVRGGGEPQPFTLVVCIFLLIVLFFSHGNLVC